MYLAINPMLNDSSTIIRAFIVSSVPPLYLIFKNVTFKEYRVESLFLSTILFLYLIYWSLFQNQSYADFLFGAYGRGNGFLPLVGLYLLIIISAECFLRDNELFFRYTYAILSLSIIYGIFQAFGLDMFKYSGSNTGIRLTLGNANFASALLGIVSAIPLGKFFDNKGKNKLLHLFIYFLTLILIFQTDSSQGFVLWILTGLLFIYFRLVKSGRLNIGKLIIINSSILISLISILLVFKDSPRILNVWNSFQVEARYEHWLTGLRIWKDHAFFGIGIDNLSKYSGQYMSQNWSAELGGASVPDKSHNTVIDHFANGGTLVGILWVGIIVLISWYAIKIQINKQTSLENWKIQALGCMWFTYLLQTFISTDQILITFLGFLTAGGVIGVYHREYSKK
jgi:O-antigen ligase